jgi:hypothetical protein
MQAAGLLHLIASTFLRLVLKHFRLTLAAPIIYPGPHDMSAKQKPAHPNLQLQA